MAKTTDTPLKQAQNTARDAQQAHDLAVAAADGHRKALTDAETRLRDLQAQADAGEPFDAVAMAAAREMVNARTRRQAILDAETTAANTVAEDAARVVKLEETSASLAALPDPDEHLATIREAAAAYAKAASARNEAVREAHAVAVELGVRHWSALEEWETARRERRPVDPNPPSMTDAPDLLYTETGWQITRIRGHQYREVNAAATLRNAVETTAQTWDNTTRSAA